jgi:hypothetical protein
MPSGPSIVFSAATKQRLIDVLRSPSAQKIDFYLGYLHVSGFGYVTVADAVSNGSIGIRFGQVPAGAAAAFDGEDKVFDFPEGQIYGSNLVEQALMVHEATHAAKWLIFKKAGIIENDTQDEAAAYLASTLYLMDNGRDWAPGHLIYVEASRIARSLKKGSIVPAHDEARLRSFVTLHPVYSSMGVTYNSTVYVPRKGWFD